MTNTGTQASAFDFLAGAWNVRNRWLTDFLDETSGWEEFPAVSRGTRHFDGAASFDEIEFPTKGFAGLTLRLYDPARDEWSLYWASRRTGTLFPPVVGRFEGERGEFHGDDTHAGRPVRVRFVWSGITARTARWEQAFSTDGGLTWTTNWVMELTRR
ncbi:hypothetical protein FNH05_29045 [Amycolatopsis rhizosphaerae]|uniref:DUF1579 domain-containing protein n=1 Tax=Amycolatopsis rhizosphaerae TaxID=2053003 RepID=A0A558B235_9PSEU|nr:hypothetical protein [Amycolatopsis rhizosphaerae]TVT30566.1 hypothetical protein FNH05_29045 [Amycolatopsis rhizosphaerae]